MRTLTYLFFQYARVRTWMERAPRLERWPWYVGLLVWLAVAIEVTF